MASATYWISSSEMSGGENGIFITFFIQYLCSSSSKIMSCCVSIIIGIPSGLPHYFQIWPYIQSWLFRCFLLSKQLLKPAISTRKSPFLLVFKGQRPLCYFLFFLELFVSMVKHFSIFHFRQKLVFNFSDIFSLDIPKSLLYKGFWPLMQFEVQGRKCLFTKITSLSG